MNINPILLLNYDKWLFFKDEIHAINLKSILIEIFNSIQSSLKKYNIEVGIILESDKEIQKLNKKFRFKDKPTNVLSFPLYNFNYGQLIEIPLNETNIYIGDIIFAFETIERELKEQNKSLNDHFTHLFIHSVLHLLGFDHETEKDAIIMEDLEVKILEKFNISSPYII